MARRAKTQAQPTKVGKSIYALTLDQVRALGKLGMHPDPKRQAIGNRIRQLLDDRRRTKYELAAFCGTQTNAVEQWCIGRTKPSTENYILIADFLDVSLDYLLRDDGTQPPTGPTGRRRIKQSETHADG